MIWTALSRAMSSLESLLPIGCSALTNDDPSIEIDENRPESPDAAVFCMSGQHQAIQPGVLLHWESRYNHDRPFQAIQIQRRPSVKGNSFDDAWETVFSANSTNFLPDIADQESTSYLYRIRVSGNVMSNRDQIKSSSGGLVIIEATSFDDVVRNFGLLGMFFLVVYALVHVRVKDLAQARTRHSRLQRIMRTTVATSQPSKRKTKAIRSGASGSSSATSISSEPHTPTPTPKHRLSFFATSSASSEEEDDDKKFSYSTCGSCNKKFGLFRRRFVCASCQEAVLCRKCGFAGRHASPEDENVLRSPSTPSGKFDRSIVCHRCCQSAVRYSTASSVRPSVVSIRGIV